MIEIKGLSFYACHGVLEEEKRNPQPFVFDIRLFFDDEKAKSSDDVADTVNYADVCETVKAVCCENSFNLIEKLADAVCLAVMEGYPRVVKVETTVHKPHAPVSCNFSDISFTCLRERVKVVLSLGSNEGDRKAALDGAIEMLKSSRGIKILKVSDYIETAPYGGIARNTFLNCALVAECLLPPRALLDELHRIEKAFGRERKVRWGDRTLDIDIIFFGNKVIDEEGLCIPHPDYAARPFVLAPIREIASDFVCPRSHKRVADM